MPYPGYPGFSLWRGPGALGVYAGGDAYVDPSSDACLASCGYSLPAPPAIPTTSIPPVPSAIAMTAAV